MICQKLFVLPRLTAEKGSLPQLKVLINLAAKVDSDKNMKGFEDFLSISLHAYVTNAGNICYPLISFNSVEVLAKEMIIQYIIVLNADAKLKVKDKVHLYALQVITLGLLWAGFCDSIIKEGDDDHILIYYKFMLHIFKTSRCFNYSKESVIFLT